MDIDRKIIEKYKSANQYGALIGMALEILDEGEVKYALKIEEKHLATPIAAHGGVIASLIDGASGVAALTIAQINQNIVSTVSLTINYLKPVKLGDTLVAIGKVVNAGKKIMYVETTVTNQDGVIIAKANGIFNAYPANKAF